MEVNKRKPLCSVTLICLLLFVGQLDTSVLTSPGDITVIGMFEVFEPDGMKCGGAVKVNSVMYAEAIRWYLKRLSAVVGGIPFKIGFEAHATCRIDALAAEEAANIVHRLLHPDPGNQELIAGVIGPEYSSEAVAVSRVLTLLNAVNGDDRLPQIGFSATAASLQDREDYPNFISVVPDDGVQTEAIVQTLLHLDWNRIAIVYENNTLGQEASAALTERAKTAGICIALMSPIDVNNGVDVSSINEVVSEIIYGTGDVPAVTGFVFFCSASTANMLFRSIESRAIQYAPIAMLTESIELDTTAFKDDTGNLFRKTKGSLAISPPYRVVDEFRDYWISIFTNNNVYTTAVVENPWLELVVKKINSTCETTSCNFQQLFEAQPVYVQYAIFAAHALAVGITSAHKDYCSPTQGICPNMVSTFKPSKILEKLNDKSLDLENDFNFKLNSLRGVTMTLGGENGRLRANPDYQVFNFRQLDAQFKLHKIGDLNGDVLSLNTADIRDYPDGIVETSWPDIRRAQCSVNLKCTECIPRDLPERVVYVPGDVYVIGLVPVYDRSTISECDTVRTINGYQLVETIKFAVEKANKKTGIFSNLFKNVQVGLIVFNSCNNEVVVQRILYNLIKDGLTLPDGQHLDLQNKVLGFIGDVGSSISIAIAQALTRLKFVQISYASMSSLLNDRSIYPYFLRVGTPDDVQARVMIDIVKKLGGNFIQIIYSKGAYGEGGLANVLEAAKAKTVCVIKQIEVVEETANFHSYYEQLRKNPEAKIVIVFLRSHIVRPLMTVVTERMRKGEFIFIGSATWAKNPDVLIDDSKQNLLGSFSLALELAYNIELQTHMTKLMPVGFNTNPWLKLYLESKLSCYFPDSFDKSKPKPCEDVVDFEADPNFSLTPWAPAADAATTSLLIGAGNHLKQECGDVASVCDGYKDNIEGLIQELKEVQLDLHGLGIRTRVFNENGDGSVGYVLYNIQKDSNDPQKLAYKRVGQYPLLGNPTFSTDLIVSPTPEGITSVCPSEQACSSCFDDSSKEMPQDQKPESEQGPAVYVLGALLGVAVIAIIVLIVVLVRKVNHKPEEDPYLHPTDRGPGFECQRVSYGTNPNDYAGYETGFDNVKEDEMDANEMI